MSTVKETFGELLRQVKKFLLHTYIKREQASAFDQLKSSVNTENVVIQVDFAENAAILNQNEIQSAHWVHSQATIFPAHAWISKNESQSFAIISDTLDHTKLTVYKFLSFLLKYLKNQYPTIKNIQVFSDGPSSQFKQRFLFSNLYLFEQENDSINITWNFFAMSQGKGAVDGIGGAVKRTVWRHIKAGKVTISTPEEYASVASKLIPNVIIQYISSDEIISNTESLLSYWEKILPVPNIHSVHSVKATSHNEILVSDTSLSEIKKSVILYKEDSENEIIDDEKTSASNNLQLNDWVVVNYESAFYPGVITQLYEEDAEVSVMHRAEGHFKWPTVEDKIFYSLENVVRTISPPIPIGNGAIFI